MMAQVGKFQLRIGLVLYGGSSLAVYMSGMTQELLALVRASQARRVLANPGRQSAELTAWAQREKTGNAYFSLLEQADVDVVIDVIAGTSAGGLNGLMLAKALAAGAPELGPITDSLWRDKADMEELARFDKDPRSVLSGDYLYAELLKMMQQVQNAGRQDLADMVKILDLFITATDVRGHAWTRWDRFNQKLQGQSHKYLFHLMKRQPQRDDSAESDRRRSLRGYHRNDFIAGTREQQAKVDALLAKIGRATSAFPGVFPPILISPAEAREAGVNVLGDVAPVYKDGIWFSDGGMLVNAPFEPVLDTIFERGANQPVQRVLVFLEPDPTVASATVQSEPSMVETALSAVTLPMDQDILDKLDRLRAENARRRRLMELMRGLDGVVAPGAAGDLPDHLRPLVQMGLSMAQAAAAAAPARQGEPAPVMAPALQVSTYYQIRLNRLNQVLRDAFTRSLECAGLSEPALGTAVAGLLGKVSPGKYASEDLAATLAFLERYDAEYQARRYHYLLARIHEHCRPGAEFVNPTELEQMLNHLWGALEDWNNALWVLAHAGALGAQPDRWQSLCTALDRSMVAYAEAVKAGRTPADELAAAAEALDSYMDGVMSACTELSSAAFHRAEVALKLDDDGPRLDVALLEKAFRDFVALDMVLFPIQVGSGRSDWGEVGLYGFTPNAARSWVTKSAGEKLAGEALGHFGAFLDARWRSNDIMWGRLDAAEEIVRMVAQEAKLVGETDPLTPPLHRMLMARRRKILSGYPDLIDMEQLRVMTRGGAPLVAAAPQPLPGAKRVQGAWQMLTRGQVAASLQQAATAAGPAFGLDQVPDDVLLEYLMQHYKVGEEGVESLPPQKLAGEVLMMLDNTAQALGKPAPSPMVGKLQQALVGVLKPLDWIARLILLPQQGLAGQIQQNLAPLMTLVGAVLLVLGATGAVTLSNAGIILVVALFTPVLLDVFFRPTGLKVLLLGLPTLLTCLTAAAPRLLTAAWLRWLEPVLTWLARWPALGRVWVPFVCVFAGSLLTWWSGARWRRRMRSMKAGAGA